jgi:hypothetical protein
MQIENEKDRMKNKNKLSDSEGQQSSSRPKRLSFRRGFIGFFALTGLATVVSLLVAVVIGVQDADRTNGGYEYPYQGWTGTPIDYPSWYLSEKGLFLPGPIVDQDLNCTTGQLTLKVFGIIDIEFRPLSDRAKVIHQPQVACRDKGFDTSQWDSINDPKNLYPDLGR